MKGDFPVSTVSITRGHVFGIIKATIEARLNFLSIKRLFIFSSIADLETVAFIVGIVKTFRVTFLRHGICRPSIFGMDCVTDGHTTN